MQVLFAIVVIVIAVAAVVYFVTAAQRKPAGAPAKRTLADLKVGDIVRYRMLPDNNFSVAGFIDYSEEGYTWREVRLVDGQTVRWLEIEEEDFEVNLTLWREIDLEVDIAGQIPRDVTYQGVTYRQEENGTARAVLTGQTGNRQQLQCRYWDYKAVNGAGLLSVEQWGSEFEVSLGDRVHQPELDIFTP